MGLQSLWVIKYLINRLRPLLINRKIKYLLKCLTQLKFYLDTVKINPSKSKRLTHLLESKAKWKEKQLKKQLSAKLMNRDVTKMMISLNQWEFIIKNLNLLFSNFNSNNLSFLTKEMSLKECCWCKQHLLKRSWKVLLTDCLFILF